MSIASGFRTRRKMVRKDDGGLKDLFCAYIDRICEVLLGIKTDFYNPPAKKRFIKMFKREDCYHIKDVRLPLLYVDDEKVLWQGVLYDTFYSYLYCGDKYDEETFNNCDKLLSEGLYGLVNSLVNVTVDAGDIVIDAGSWIGDFAAYASVKGAITYAFEPADKTFQYLEQTAKLNKNIILVKKGLSDQHVSTPILEHKKNSGANRLKLNKDESSKAYFESSSSIETIRLDDFVHENNLKRVDFIKSDIEGFERHMLAGAQGVLREFAPKLALCTYHLPDDPQVMADLIMQANPKYNIVQKRMKLFASVPK